ncbi:MAG: hypothetical protein E6G91_08365 [Alphaproteobacteria bacterium]|nr:MAG: hypothetical protein E6G91_08365 [Alphaproteobacteria bacterium]
MPWLDALYQEITIKDGRVVERNFDSYEMMRLAELPKVETVIVPSGGFWGASASPRSRSPPPR